MKKHLAIGALLSVASMASAEEENNSKRLFDQGMWGVSLHSMLIDSEVAVANRVGEDLLRINFFIQGRIGNLLMSAGLGALSYDDLGSYSVRVEDQFGNQSTQSATASGMEFNTEIGYRHQISNFNMDLLGGYSYFNSSRSVTNCSDCPDEDLDISSGAYLKPSIGYQFGESWALELNYTSYASADVSDNMGLVFSMRY